MNFESEINHLKSQMATILERLEALEKANTPKNNNTTSYADKPSQKTSSQPKAKFDNNVYLSTKSGHHLINGNTYNIRTLLKEKGARWDADNKGWKVKETDIELSDLEALIREQGLQVENKSGKSSKAKVKSDKGERSERSKMSEKLAVKKVKKSPTTQVQKPLPSAKFEMLSDSDSD